MKKLKVLGLLVAPALLAMACNMDALKNGGKKGDANGAQTSNFAGKGTLCGTYVSLRGFASEAKAGSARPIVLIVALGVCGKMENKEWKALAVSQDAHEVSVKQGEHEIKSDLLLDGKIVSVKRPNGKYVKLGELSGIATGAHLTLEPGMKVNILVNGEPFNLEQHSKNSSGMSVQVTLPGE